MSRAFVIHVHSGCGPLHFDLMLEGADALATWQVPLAPAGLGPGESTPARRLPDHRTDYLTYEGPVSRGRGTVARLDGGPYELLAAAEARRLVRLCGEKVRGSFELRRTGPGQDDWTLARLPGDQGS